MPKEFTFPDCLDCEHYKGRVFEPPFRRDFKIEKELVSEITVWGCELSITGGECGEFKPKEGARHNA